MENYLLTSSQSDSPKDLCKTLSNDYPHILKAITREKYELEYLEYDVFQEIVFNDKIVGFFTIKRIPKSDNIFYLAEAYIMPKFRGRNLLYKSIYPLFLDDNFDLYLRKPNRAIIKVLIKNNLAYEIIDKNLVVSYINFFVEIEDAFKNEHLSRLFRKSYVDRLYATNLFDFYISSSLFIDPDKNFYKRDDIFVCTQPRKYDYHKNKLSNRLSKIDEEYLEAQLLFTLLLEDEREEFVEKTKKRISDSIKIDKIIGNNKKLSKKFYKDLKHHGLSKKDGFKILNHVLDAKSKDQLNDKSTLRRVEYLLDNIEDVDKEVGEDFSVEICPFCGTPVPDYINSCVKCGFKIRTVNFELLALIKYGSFKNIFKSKLKIKFNRFFRR